MNPTKVYDVFISGGGPAGAAAAIGLKNSGLEVLLAEKKSFPRDKICGDALSADVWNQLDQLGFSLEEVKAFEHKLPCYGARIISAQGEPIDFEFPDLPNSLAPGYISERWAFDEFMWTKAISTPGVHAQENCSVKSATRKGDLWAIETSKGTFQSRLLLIADGAQSPLARSIGKVEVERDHYCAGLRQYWEGVEGFHEGGFIELHFYKEIIPGYFWMFPLPDGRANIGIGMLSSAVARKKVDLKKHLEYLITQHPEVSARFKNAQPLEKVRGWGLPIGSKKRTISGDHFLLLGDAASMIDPATGEGIGNAIRTGRVAADIIPGLLAKNKTLAKDLAAYDKEVYRRMWGELYLSRRVQRLLRFPWILNMVVRKANKNPDLKALLIGTLTDMEKRALLTNPWFLFKLLFS